MSRLSLVAVPIALLLAAPARADVLVVGPEPDQHPTLQAAIDAAADGDILLVRVPASPEFTLAGKALVIVGDFPTAPQVGAPLALVNEMGPGSQHTVVTGLAAGQSVVLRNLALRGLELHDVAGQVWIEDCELGGTAPALRATGVARLVVAGGSVRGPDAQPLGVVPGTGGRALELVDTKSLLLGVTARGGDGVDFHCDPFDNCLSSGGFDALALQGGSARVAGGSYVGGAGGDGGKDAFFVCTPGGAGGHGIALLAGAPQLTLQQVSASGGAGGAGGAFPCIAGSNFPGAPGLSVAVQTGGASILPGGLPELNVSSVAAEGDALSLFVLGPAPGEGLLLVVGLQPALAPVGALAGPLLVTPPFTLLPLGAMPPAGAFGLVLPVPDLGPLQGVALVMQLLAVPAAGPLQAGWGSVGVLLEAGS